MGSLYGNDPETERKTGPWWRKTADEWCDWLAFLIGAAFASAMWLIR